MKIYLDQIPDQGLELSETSHPDDLDLERPDIRFNEPLNIQAQISKGINHLAIDLQIEGTMHLSCSRCLEEFSSPLVRRTKLNLLIEGKKEFDLTDNLREEIILSYPLKPLCRADCQGLCPVCGQNLNKGRCNHGSS